MCLVLRLGTKYAIFWGRKVPCLAPKIWGQLFQGFWQFLSDFDETWYNGPYWPYFNAGQLKLPNFCFLDPISAPKLNFWGPTGTKPYLWPDLDQIWFGGPFLALNKGEILTFEIGDEICHFLAPRLIFWGPTGTYGDKTLFTAQIGPNLFWWALFGIL